MIYYIYFIVDFEKNIKHIVSLSFKEKNWKPILSNIKFNVFDFKSIFIKNSITNTPRLITLKIKLNSKNKKNINFFYNYIDKNFLFLRMLGINIPLILIQNYLKRKFEAKNFIKTKNIVKNKESYSYNFKFDKIFIDLDETIIFNNKPIIEVKNFLLKFHDKQIVLVTRHKGNISKAINLSGLNIKIFSKIIKVKSQEKKSNKILKYLKGFDRKKCIFIDNEFKERADVFMNIGIKTLDLNQLDFI